MRRSPLEEGQRWLAQAEEDLKWVKDLADRGGYHLACFLAQQTAEKAMKAFLYAQDEEVVLGHSVERLCALASRLKPELTESVKRWAVLDSYYVTTRYPNGLPDSIPAKVYTQEIAQMAAALADEIVASIRSELARLDQATKIESKKTDDQAT